MELVFGMEQPRSVDQPDRAILCMFVCCVMFLVPNPRHLYPEGKANID